jgi:PAS domain S-box-containing protein
MSSATGIDLSKELQLGIEGCLDASLASTMAILDSVPARAMVLDREERVVYANPEFVRFSGKPATHILNQPIVTIIGTEAYQRYATLRTQLMRGELVSVEGWTTLPGFGPRYLRQNFLPLGVTAGKPAAIVIMSQDLTDLKQREVELSQKVEELEASEALKSAIVDHAVAAFVSTDRDGRIVEFNPAAEAMFGHRREDVLGRSVADVIIPPRFRAAHHAGMARVDRGGEQRVIGRRVELSALRSDGTEFPMDMMLWRVDVGGNAYYTASMSDLTGQKAAQAEIELHRDRMRQAEKLAAMGSLLASVAHELNNPLTIVMGSASTLEERLSGSPHERHAHRVYEAAQRCGRVVHTFLNMARSRPAERLRVSLNALASAAIEVLRYGLRSHGIEVRTTLGTALPDVLVDGDQIGQVILNLIINAQQALVSLERARTLELSTGATPSDDARPAEAWLRVADNGPGVLPDLREKVFEPFFTTKPDQGGTGLGLAVSSSIAREHGGRLVLEHVDQGASFLLVLPASFPGTIPAEFASMDDPELKSTPEVPRRILVVDDELEIGDMMRDFLESSGYDVRVAESGVQAVEQLREQPFDLIVSDLRMPEMDGAALWRCVVSDYPALAHRIVFVTGDTLSIQAQRFLSETQCVSVDKPFTKSDLLTAVKQALRL